MALAMLGGLAFRINPSAIEWNFQIKTHVEETIGGRVVQVLGATLSDIVISGEYGQVRGHTVEDPEQDPGQSWRLAEEFVRRIRLMMAEQSADATKHAMMHPPILFEFPDYGWRFQVYIKAIASQDSDAAIVHTTGKMAYKYRLVLFVVDDISDNLTRAGTSLQNTKGFINQKKAMAINAYIARISAGVGWKKSIYNQPSGQDSVTVPTGDSADPVALPHPKPGGL